MNITKIKLKYLKPNPFKKWLNEGKLNQEQIDSIKANLDKLGLMDAIPIVKIKNEHHIVSHHHRVEALKQQFGEDYEVECVEHNYDAETMLRGMVTENITQRSGDFRQIKENLVLIRDQVKQNPKWLEGLYIYKPSTYKVKGTSIDTKKHQTTSQGIGIWQIYRWVHNIDNKEKEDYLKENKKAKNQIISFATIQQTLQIEDKLDEDLKEEVDKKHDKTQEEREEGLNYSQALLLSQFEDKEEQKDLAEVLKNSEEQRVREQSKLLTIYKKAPEEVKQLIRLGNLDLKYIRQAIDELASSEEVDIPEETLEEIRNGLKENEKEFEKTMKNPEVIESLKKQKNWKAHQAIKPYIDGKWLYCPYCGKPASECLRWICKSEKTIQEAIQQASDNYGE